LNVCSKKNSTIIHYHVRYDFRIKRCSIRLYFQLVVGGLMSYLRYLCLFAHSIVQHILCCIVFSVYGPNVASCSGFSILDFSNVISIFQNVSLNVE
jgi:hypothetical protein